MVGRDTSPQVKSSLQRQMILTLSGIIVGLMLLIALPLVFISVSLQRQAAAREHQEITDRTAQQLSDLIEGLETNQLQMSLSESTDPAVTSRANQITTLLNLTIPRVSAQIQEVITDNKPLDQVFSLNPQIRGVKRFSLEGVGQPAFWVDEPLAADNIQPSSETLALAGRGLSTQDAFFFDQNYTPLLVIAAPVTDPSQTNGLVLAWVEIPSLWPMLTDQRIGRTGYLYIVDAAGQPVALPDGSADPLALPVGLPQADHTQAHPGLKGETVISKVAPIANTPWYLITEIPIREANANLRSLVIILTSTLLLGIALASLMARLFSRWLLSPIEVLHHSATRINAGDLAHRIELRRDDELGFLAQAFNQMVATLEQTINQLHTVSQNLLSAQEAERHRIAQEIHDELGQMLTALKLNLWLAIKADPDNRNLIAAHDQATAVQEKARTLSHELRPAMLDDLGLLATLGWYIDRFEQRANLAIILDAPIDESKLSSGLKTSLYRLIVEALTNISKHAQAAVVEINFQQHQDSLQVTISDDGIGFETSILSHAHSLGIASMRERVNLLQGKFLIESEVGRGTRIAIILPLADPHSPDPEAKTEPDQAESSPPAATDPEIEPANP